MPGSWSGPVALAAALALALLAAGTLARGAGTFGAEPPRHSAAPPADAPRGRLVPILPPDPRRPLADVVRPGRAPVLVALPPRARLADLLAAAGLPSDLPVAGPAGPLPPGVRLVVSRGGTARLTCMPAARRLRLGLPLDPNHDDARDLARLPGLGPVLADRIVADRTRRGPYRSVHALARVRGIGPATLAKVGPYLVAAPSPCRSARR